MGYSTNSLQVETVTPEKAKEYLTYNYAHNRKLRSTWVKFLANEMREGRFMSTAEIHIVYRNGEPTLVNGQHTCSAIAMFNKPVRVTVRKTSTTEAGQIAMVYAFGHDNGIRRTFKDGLGAYNVSEELNLGPTRVDQFASALRHIRAGFLREDGRIQAASIPEIIEQMHEWAPFAHMLWACEAGDKSIKSAASKRGALSVALATFRYQNAKALEFWRAVFRPDEIGYHDPRAYARRVLEDSKGIPGTNIVTSSELSRKLARCWRAYVTGEEMKQGPKVKDITAPFVLVGTPYTGRQPAPPWWPE